MSGMFELLPEFFEVVDFTVEDDGQRRRASSRDTARIVEWLVGCLGKVDHPEPPMSKPHNRSRTRRDQLLRFAIGTSMRKETARALQPADVDGCAVKSNLADDSAHQVSSPRKFEPAPVTATMQSS